MNLTDRATAAASRLLAGRIDRRGLLTRTAIVGSAVATGGLDYILRPGTAYASVCGSGASCGSGWTAMCCTIHDGVNQCPPNSFAGGWWKADDASLCGGKARYYVDCQGECTGCGCGGGAFCASRCWNCHSHCADGACDKRHVCHNVFRYGQCERDISCSGPVLCRTISCTPPWQWADCSSASATDDATRDHSATCLSGWSHIAARYKALGSQGSALGATIHHEYDDDHARAQRYQRGRMFWTHHTGAHYLTGDLASCYEAHGAARSPLGLPVSDPRTGNGGVLVHCQHGHVTQRHGEAAHALWDAIDAAWLDQGGAGGPLSWPTTSNRSVTGGHYAWFTGGGIYNGSSEPLCVLTDPVDAVYRTNDSVAGALGWPTSPVVPIGDHVGYLAHFVGGDIIEHPTYGTHAVTGLVDLAFRALGGPTAALGYPTTGLIATTGHDGTRGQVMTTVDGAVAETAGSPAAYAVWSHVASAWLGDGGAPGALGFPTATMAVDGAGNQHGTFQYGTIDYDAATGQVTITPSG